MNLDQCTAYVRHQTQTEPGEDRRAAFRRTLDYLESFVQYPGTRQQVKKALREWISQSSRTSRRVQGDAADPFFTQMLVYAHLCAVLSGEIPVCVPTDAPKDAEVQWSLWDQGSSEV